MGKAVATHRTIIGNSHKHKSTWLSTSRFATESGSHTTTRTGNMGLIIAGEGDY
jgi:hypothetical protein